MLHNSRRNSRIFADEPHMIPQEDLSDLKSDFKSTYLVDFTLTMWDYCCYIAGVGARTQTIFVGLILF
jgi:hypothetical protein